MAENGKVRGVRETEPWPAGRSATEEFARQLVDMPAGYSLLEDSIAAQRMIHGGHAPRPTPADVLCSCGLARAEGGYVFATDALRAAVALLTAEEVPS